MPNTNTIARCGSLPGAAQGASSSNEFQFVDSLAAQANVRVGSTYLKRRQFLIKAGGRSVGEPDAVTLTLKLYLGKSATIGSNVLVFSSGAKTITGLTGSWELEAIAVINETSKAIEGIGYGAVNNIAVAQAALSATTTADPNAEIAFTVTGQFSTSDVANAAICDYFEVEGL